MSSMLKGSRNWDMSFKGSGGKTLKPSSPGQVTAMFLPFSLITILQLEDGVGPRKLTLLQHIGKDKKHDQKRQQRQHKQDLWRLEEEIS